MKDLIKLHMDVSASQTKDVEKKKFATPFYFKAPIIEKDKAYATTNKLNQKIYGGVMHWYDQHGDILVQRNSKMYEQILYLTDHSNSILDEIGDVNYYEEVDISWKDLGVQAEGKTTALVFDVTLEKSINPRLLNKFLENKLVNHSIGYLSKNPILAFPNDSAEFKLNNELYNYYLPKIGNKEMVVDKFEIDWEYSIFDLSAVQYGSSVLAKNVNATGEVLSNGLKDYNNQENITQRVLKSIKF